MEATKNHYWVDFSKMKKTDYNNICKNVEEIFRINNVEHFAQVALLVLVSLQDLEMKEKINV
ncbi:hypothetical protein LCGC14_2901510 [marine sediment metagenome]|uniref:Uncharacterized protein n=1 Tax=marine sediment metagenome TaxID=412755 RepID=A0A0F8YG49_9ZZZZ